MTNEEKYKLIFNYLNKLIEDKKSTKSYRQYNNDGFFGFQEFNSDGYESVEFRVVPKGISLSFQDGSYVSVGMTAEQRVEVEYLFLNILRISEENGIEKLIKIINE